MRVLVAGATGETGRRVVSRLLAAGHTVRGLSRSVERARGVLGPAIELVEGDVRDPATLQGLGRDIDVAILAQGTRTYIGANGGPAVDAAGTGHLARALAGDGVGHLVLLSAFGLDRRSLLLSAFSRVLNGYFAYKELAEQAIRAAGVPYTIVRPVQFRPGGPRSAPRLNQSEPLSLLRTVSRDVVADVLVACAASEAARGKSFELCEGRGAPGLDAQLAAMLPDGAWAPPPRTPLFARG